MSFHTQTKLAIYRHFAGTGQKPSLEVVAERVGSDVSSVRNAYGRFTRAASIGVGSFG
jgi:hypothetical protein